MIDQDQTGFLKGRHIGQNIVTILDIIHHKDNKSPFSKYQ